MTRNMRRNVIVEKQDGDLYLGLEVSETKLMMLGKRWEMLFCARVGFG